MSVRDRQRSPSSRELTWVEKEKGVTQHPVCNACWDSPDPDTFYKVLQQVIDVLKPIHKRPGALITAASASEAVGLCIIQVRNLFGPSLDFVRRAFRGAALHDVRLETFHLDDFLLPLELHKTKPWTMGMKRYDCGMIQNQLTPVSSLSPLQATIRRERTECYGKPAYPPPNGRHRRTFGARIKARELGVANRSIFLNLVISLFNFVKYNHRNKPLLPPLVQLRSRIIQSRTSRASVTTLSINRYHRLTTSGTTATSLTMKKVRPCLRGLKAWQARKQQNSGNTYYDSQTTITVNIWHTTPFSLKPRGSGPADRQVIIIPDIAPDTPHMRVQSQENQTNHKLQQPPARVQGPGASPRRYTTVHETPYLRGPRVSTDSFKIYNG